MEPQGSTHIEQCRPNWSRSSPTLMATCCSSSHCWSQGCWETGRHQMTDTECRKYCKCLLTIMHPSTNWCFSSTCLYRWCFIWIHQKPSLLKPNFDITSHLFTTDAPAVLQMATFIYFFISFPNVLLVALLFATEELICIHVHSGSFCAVPKFPHCGTNKELSALVQSTLV